jgi:dipeptidyl aminopeptidase/acylaminoacyl peptidase
MVLGTQMGIAQDLSRYEKKTFTSPQGSSILYRIVYPDNYKRTKKYPLVVSAWGR